MAQRSSPPGSSAITIDSTGFDPLGPTVHTCRLASGRHVRYIDEGHESWPVALVFGGAGTSVRALRLLEFARSFRQELGVRLMSVERNGLGLTPYDPDCGPSEHAKDVWELLDRRGVRQIAVVAISGGGPYAAHVMAARPERVTSVHLACALSDRGAGAPLQVELDAVLADPVGWWAFPPSSPVHRIPGFAASAVEEATHALLARGPSSGPDGLRQALELYAHGELPDLSGLNAPAFLYWGADDVVVPSAHLRRWEEVLPGRRLVRLYPGEGHVVQYRHWDQILCDVVHGGSRTVVSREGKTWLLPAEAAARELDLGATLGLAAWEPRAERSGDECALDEGDEHLTHRCDVQARGAR
ncbi:alpha/beta fold hydrolase [Sinomonas humi]|uniref:alpha/beta fold hydrolase n=1 Tax=Sinomonas humi TaxID=1338436 RepID=UPI00068CDED2|nr:alpha/beta hydrolase [Sinomonas humi]